jgi:A/G-specific adenine glycosylase
MVSHHAEKLQPPPSKPLFFYLVPLLRTRDILDEIIRIIPDGKYERLRELLDLVEGPPNNVQQNLKSAAASLDSPALIEKADAIARDVYEYLKGIDYQTYYDSIGASRGSRGGQELKEMFDFSSKSADAAQSKLEEFLKLMPKEELAAAKSQANISF